MKKYIISLVSLFAAFSLSAQSENSTQFSSFGSDWVEINAGSTIFSASAFGGTMDEAGCSVYVEGNYAIYNSGDGAFSFGLDLGATFAYDEVEFDNILGLDSYTGIIELKPYLNVFKSESLGVKVFANPFIGYAGLDLEVLNVFDFSEGGLLYGIKVGVEVSFLEDFYIAPAYKYTRVEPDSSYVKGFNRNELELEVAYRLTEDLSFNLTYVHCFEETFFDILELSSDKITAGVRYTF